MTTDQQLLTYDQQLTIELLKGRMTTDLAWETIRQYALQWTDQPVTYQPPHDYILDGPRNGWALNIIPWEDDGRPLFSFLYDDCLEGHVYDVAHDHAMLWSILHDIDSKISVVNTVVAHRG